MNILIIEDEPFDCDMIRGWLTGMNNQIKSIDCAPTLQEGIQKLSKHSEINLVLLDLGLPDATGLMAIDTVQSVRKDLHIIVLSANSNRELIREAINKGVRDYIVKEEATSTKVLNAVESTMKNINMSKRLEKITESVTNSFSSRRVLPSV